MRWFILFAVSIFLFTVPASAVKLESIALPRGWSGGAYASNSGRFSSCLAVGSYKSGHILNVSLGAKFDWSVGVKLGRGNIRNGITDVRIRFDRGPWRYFRGVVSGHDLLIVPMPSDSHLMRLFRRGNHMSVRFAGKKLGFRLTGTSKVFKALVVCVARYIAAGKSLAAVPKNRTSTKSAARAGTQPTPQAKRRQSTGTGITISRQGHILTNNHVIKGCKAIQVTQRGELPATAILLKSDRKNDLAVIKIDRQVDAANVGLFSRERSVRPGATIAVYGFPFAGALSSSGNIVSGNVTSLAGLNDDARYLQISAPVQPGNSGGPLIDETGKVVGVVTARMDDMATVAATGALPQNVNFAIKSNIALNFLDAHAIPYGLADAGQPLALTELAARSQRFTVFIQCR